MDWVKPVISALMFSPLFEFEKNNSNVYSNHLNYIFQVIVNVTNNSVLNKPAREE
jgi:hypothetical protein